MSVHKRKHGQYQVKWRDHDGNQFSRTFPRKGAADGFNDDVKIAKRQGPKALRLLVDADAQATTTLRYFVTHGFRTHAATVSQGTRDGYKQALTYHLQELLDLPLDEIDVPRLMEHQAYLLATPRPAGGGKPVTGNRTPETVRKAFDCLSGIMQVAVEHGLISGNPVRSMTKVKRPVRAPVVPFAPTDLEAVLGALEGRDRIVGILMGYFGLRPLEALLVPWGELRGDTLTIRADLTKSTAAFPRTITGPASAARELRRIRMEAGVPADDQPIIGDVGPGYLHQWGPRVLKPTVKRVIGRTAGVSPYLLRHTHASLLHYCGYTVPSAAKRMGHSQAEHMATYAHVIDQLEGQPRFADLDALLAAVRSDTYADRMEGTV